MVTRDFPDIYAQSLRAAGPRAYILGKSWAPMLQVIWITLTKTEIDWKTDLQMDWLNFIEKLYSSIVDLFCRYKSDNYTNITYIDHLQRCPWSLVSQDITGYYYALCLKSASLYVPVIRSGVASPQSQHR